MCEAALRDERHLPYCQQMPWLAKKQRHKHLAHMNSYPDLRKTYGRNGRKTVLREYSWEKVAKLQRTGIDYWHNLQKEH